MLPYIFHQQMLPAPELYTAMTGANVSIGTLLFTPVKLILDNQSTSSVVLSVSINGADQVQWKTFSPGEALVLDDDIFTFPRGTTFFGNGAATGSFSVSYTYIKF
jgi:hypothetical protein